MMYIIMKTFVLLTVVVSITRGELEISSTQQNNNRLPTISKNINAIATPAKQDVYYQPMQLQPQYQQPQYQHSPYQQPQQQYIPVQFVPASLYQNGQQPQTAMIIIAQPSGGPQQGHYPSATQQLLNYFHSNPQAKYQLLNGYQQQQQQQQQPVQQFVAQSPAAQPSYTYQIMAAQPQYQFTPSPSHQQSIQYQSQPIQQYVLPTPSHQPFGQNSQYQLAATGNSLGSLGGTHLSHISALAQLTAQKYLPQLRSPPIITGLENFTPEQQAQIKAQLNSGGPLTPLQSNALPTTPLHPSIGQQAGQHAGQQIGQQTGQQGLKTQSTLNTGPIEFTPSEEDKASGQTQSASNLAIAYRNQFTKG